MGIWGNTNATQFTSFITTHLKAHENQERQKHSNGAGFQRLANINEGAHAATHAFFLLYADGCLRAIAQHSAPGDDGSRLWNPKRWPCEHHHGRTW